MVHAIGIIPITNNEALILCGVSMYLLALYFGLIKKTWKKSEMGFVCITCLFLIGSVVAAPLPEETGLRIPNEPIDHVIQIEAMIKPWVFNITAIDGVPVNASKYTSASGVGYADSVVYNTLELKVGLVYRLEYTAIDTEHGLLINGLEDFWGDKIYATLPQHKTKVFFVKPTEEGTYRYRCSYLCGTGHQKMRGKVVVTA